MYFQGTAAVRNKLEDRLLSLLVEKEDLLSRIVELEELDSRPCDLTEQRRRDKRRQYAPTSPLDFVLSCFQ